MCPTRISYNTQYHAPEPVGYIRLYDNGTPVIYPLYDDEEIGFGDKYPVRESCFDDDTDTPMKLVDSTKNSVVRGIMNSVMQL